MALSLNRVKRGERLVAKKNKTGKYLAPGRMAKDLASLDGSDKDKFVLDFPDANDVLKFSVTFHVDTTQSMWHGGVYKFDIVIPDDYPIAPPKVTLNEHHRVWHPNIDVNGAVCLNIIKKDWKPVCAINQVFFGLYFLFYEPNTDDPLNLEAADEMRGNVAQFKNTVKKTLGGGVHRNTRYPNMSVKLEEFKAKKNELRQKLNGVISNNNTTSSNTTAQN